MTKIITLKKKCSNGKTLYASYAPEKGMNLISYKQDKLEIIDQSTTQEFEQRCAGLGALIGPHFYHLKDEDLPPPIDENLFPHIAKERAKGNRDVFSHGIARYVPWNYTHDETSISARISSIDSYEGYLLSALEGSNFVMTYEATLKEEGLDINLSVKSEKHGIVGLHYYYALQGNDARVRSVVENVYNEMGEFKPLPDEWTENDINHLNFDLHQEADYGFLPFSQSNQATIILENETYDVKIQSNTGNEEHSWQLWHPYESSFACIEPLSAKNPRGTIPKDGFLNVKISIHEK
ncbi:MAG: hypothetical protein P0S95_00820 [Rhabdochlamydiaceae bacterium]|nr:hypothetical protein [Candidatus Amphrikana amoebophyrae]